MRLLQVTAAMMVLGTTGTAQTASRQPPPPAGTPKDFRVPPRRTITLPNGLKVTMIPWGRVPKVAVGLQVRTGVIDEGPDEVTLSAVVADMLLEGTTTQSPQQIARAAANMGGEVSAFGSSENTTIRGEVLSEHVGAFIALVADVARNPRFTDADLARILDKHARDNAIALTRPGTQAQQTFREISFGNHPFGRMFPPDSMLRAFSSARVRGFHTKQYGAARAHLYVSGVFDARLVERAARDAFTAWQAGSAATVNPPTPVARRQVALVDRPGSVQSAMWMGLPVSDPAKPDFIALSVTDALLGGSFGSRITTNIRENKGYTYSPGSFLWTEKGTGLWVEVADVTTNVTGPALKEIFGEMQRLRTEAPPVEELEGIKRNMAGVFTIQNSSRTGLIGQLQYADLHGLGEDYLTTYVKNVMAVTPEQVRGIAEKHLDPSRVSIAIVGDKKQVDPQLGQFRAIVP